MPAGLEFKLVVQVSLLPLIVKVVHSLTLNYILQPLVEMITPQAQYARQGIRMLDLMAAHTHIPVTVHAIPGCNRTEHQLLQVTQYPEIKQVLRLSEFLTL